MTTHYDLLHKEWVAIINETKSLYADIEDVPLFQEAALRFREAMLSAERCYIRETINRAALFGQVMGKLITGIETNEIPVATGKEKKNDLAMVVLLKRVIKEDMPSAVRNALKGNLCCKISK